MLNIQLQNALAGLDDKEKLVAYTGAAAAAFNTGRLKSTMNSITECVEILNKVAIVDWDKTSNIFQSYRSGMNTDNNITVNDNREEQLLDAYEPPLSIMKVNTNYLALIIEVSKNEELFLKIYRLATRLYKRDK